MTPGSLRKIYLGYKTNKQLKDDLHLKSVEEEFTIVSFFLK